MSSDNYTDETYEEKHAIEEAAENYEHWRIIDGFLNYQVSTQGRVRNVLTGKVLTPNTTNGNSSVLLRNRQGTARRSIPKLMHLAFDDTEADERWRTFSDAYMYSVSSKGRLKNNRTGRILHGSKDGTVQLRDAGYQITRSISKLVEQTFGK